MAGGKGGGGGGGQGIPTAAFNQNTQAQQELSLGEQEQAHLARDEFLPKFEDEIWPYAQDFMNEQQQAGHAATDFANDVRGIYRDQYIPMSQRFYNQVTNYASPERQNLEAGIAAQTQAAAADQAINTTKRQLASYGISPTEGLIAGGALDLGRSASIAAAASGARRGVYDTQLGLEKQALDLSNTTPTQFANLSNVANQGRAAGLTGGTQALTTGANVLGTPLGWSTAAGDALKGATANMTGQGELAISANKINQQEAAATGQAIGNVIGTVGKVATAFI
jgi:hypothetical protein